MATLKIYNDIQTEREKSAARFFGEAEGVCFKDINAFCESIPDDDNDIDLRLHCDGGSVTEGWAIYDRLRQTGKQITATVEGNCSSMATVVLMAAPKERRRAYESAHICVHNPWMCPWALGEAVTADDLQKYANDLRAEQAKMVALYVERCGCTAEEIQALMDKDQYIDVERAQQLGIIGEVALPLSAKKATNKIDIKTQNCKRMENEVKVKASVLDKVLAKLGLKSLDDFDEAKAMDLNTAAGDVLTVDREDGEPQVGDSARPDGEWLMPDGVTIVVENGVIVEVRPAEEAPEGEKDDDKKGEDDATEEMDERDEEEQRLRDRIAELEKENDELKQRLEDAEKNAKTADDKRVLNAVRMAGGEKALSVLKSTYKPKEREQQGKRAQKHDGDMSAQSIIERHDASYNKKKK